MTLLHFLFTFTIMILLSCPAIIGWYVITRGTWYIRPDGTWKKYGMIFKEWSLFWEQYRKEKIIYYEGDELKNRLSVLQKVRPDMYDQISRVTKKDFSLKDPYYFNQSNWAILCDILGSLDPDARNRADANTYRIFIKEPVYVFPSWVRKPLSECPPCMSSAYGSIIYWFVVLNGPSGFFAWAAKENLAKFGFWVIFCLILACGNKYLEQKLKL